MNFLDGHLFPENQDKLVITAAPYGPEWIPSDFPEDIPVSMEAQIQKAVDCYNAGATVLHVHVREADGRGSKRLSMFNELLAGIRKAVPDMILQVGGSISFAPEGEGAAAKWLSDDTRHMLAELEPTPDQVTVTVNTSQMNIGEQFDIRDIAGTSLADPANFETYSNMIVPSNPSFFEEHVRVGQDYTQGMSQLLQYLINQAAIPEYQVRWRWKPNSMAMWDNRATQHYAVMDYPPCHRKMERAGIVGTPTF